MEQNERERIEELRQQPNSDYKAQELLIIAGKYNGPQKKGCWCKEDRRNNYITEFYKWWDGQENE